MNEWSLAIRNLFRNRRRSLSTLLALAIGLSAVLLFSGFKSNLGFTMLTAYVRSGGHLQVQHRDYFLYGGGNPSAYGIVDYAPLLDSIRSDAVLKPMVAVVTPMLRFGGLAGNFDAGISRTVIGTGYVAADMNRMRQWNEFEVPLSRPKFPLEGTAADSAITGIGVARVLRLCGAPNLPACTNPERSTQAHSSEEPTLPSDIAALAERESTVTPRREAASGARMELLASGSRGAPNVAALNVVAAEDQGFKELDDISVIVHLAQAQRLVLGRAAPRITAIMVLLNKTADAAAAASRLREVVTANSGGQPLVVRTFAELNPFYVQSEQLFNVIFNFIFVLIGGIVLFTVGNTMNTAVVERTVEIGTLRAMGLRKGGIRRLFIIEGFVLGCVGALIGIAAAIALGALINHSGLTWLPPSSSERLPLQLRVLGDAHVVVATTIGLILIAAASAWWPAWRAANLNVVDALRHA
jgi:putative ABC transport system permease protein